MKRLILARHAEASRHFPLLSDFDRPLTARGRQDAAIVARRLATELHPPMRLVSSTALRALTTAQAFADALELPHAAIALEPTIYEAMPGTLLHIVNILDNVDDQVLMFGHNPGFTELAHLLGDMPFGEMPTASAVLLEFDVERWQDIVPGSARLGGFLDGADGDA